jgi:hypothetical protein
MAFNEHSAVTKPVDLNHAQISHGLITQQINARRFTLAGPFFCRISVTNIACFRINWGERRWR